MSQNLQTTSNKALPIEKLPVQVSADKDRKRFSGVQGKTGQSSMQFTNMNFCSFVIESLYQRLVCYHRILKGRTVTRPVIEGCTFIYTHSAPLISFEINCFYM